MKPQSLFPVAVTACVRQGGKYDKTYLGIYWWASRGWKLGFGLGRTWLDRSGITGVTDSHMMRLQWVHLR
jgi:phosphate-selective porin OprO/OprP